MGVTVILENATGIRPMAPLVIRKLLVEKPSDDETTSVKSMAVPQANPGEVKKRNGVAFVAVAPGGRFG